MRVGHPWPEPYRTNCIYPLIIPWFTLQVGDSAIGSLLVSPLEILCPGGTWEVYSCLTGETCSTCREDSRCLGYKMKLFSGTQPLTTPSGPPSPEALAGVSGVTLRAPGPLTHAPGLSCRPAVLSSPTVPAASSSPAQAPSLSSAASGRLSCPWLPSPGRFPSKEDREQGEEGFNGIDAIGNTQHLPACLTSSCLSPLTLPNLDPCLRYEATANRPSFCIFKVVLQAHFLSR